MESDDLIAEVEAEAVLPPSTLVAHVQSLELDTGEEQYLGFTVTDENGDAIAGARVNFQSSDSTIARVWTSEWSDSLVVDGVGPGSATVTLTKGAVSVDVLVTVGQFPGFVVLDPTDLVLSPGGSQVVTARLLDRTGEEMDAPAPFTWSSSNGAAVTVSSRGVVTSVGPEGSAVITATTDTFTARLPVFVGTPPAVDRVAHVEVAGATGLALSADGGYFVAGYDTLATGALADFALTGKLPINGFPNDLVLNADATRAYVIGATDEHFHLGVRVVDLTTNSPLDFMPVSLGYAWAGALSTDGSVLTVGAIDGFERFDLASRRSVGGTAVGTIYKITHHPSKPLLYASGEVGVLELDDRSGEIVRRIRERVNGHPVAPDGKRLYTIDYGGGIGVWNLETGAQEPSIGSVWGTDLTVSPDGRFLYVIYGNNHIVDGSRLYIVDRVSGATLREIVLGGLARRIAMSAEGVAVITNEGATIDEAGWVDFVR
jgi:hypothetical protein